MRHLLLFTFWFFLVINSFAQVTLSFSWDTIFLKGTYCRRVSLSPSNHCWTIANKDSSAVYEIDNTDHVFDRTAGVQSITSARYSDLVALDSNVVLIGTPTDYVIKYKAGVYSKIGVTTGLRTNNINSLEQFGKNICTIIPYADRNKRGVVLGTDKGLYTTYDNSTFSLLQVYDGWSQKPEDSVSIVHYTNYVTINANIKSRTPLCSDEGKPAFIDIALSSAGELSIPHSSMYDYIEQDSVNTFVDISIDYWFASPMAFSKHIWGTKNGLKYRIVECYVRPFEYLEGISVNKLYEMRFFPYEKFIGNPYQRSGLLIGSDSGLYYDPANWRIKPYYSVPDSLYLTEVTKGYKINDIEVDSCNAHVWLATDKGIIRLNIHYTESLSNGSILQHPNNNQPVCIPTTLTGPQSPLYSYQWQKDSINIPNAHTAEYIVTAAGNYQVVYTYSDGCRTYRDTSAAVKIELDTTLCIPSVLPDTAHICEGETYLINSNCSLFTNTYQWYHNNASIPNATENSYTASDAGYYKIKISNCNISKFSDSIYIEKPVLPKPTPDITPGKILCVGDSARISVPSGNYTVSWFKHGALWQPISNENFRYATVSDNYFVVFQKNHCAAPSDLIQFVFNPISKVVIQKNKNLPLCTGDEIMLTAQNNSNNYHWSTGENTQTIYTSHAGLYEVTSFDHNNCKSSDSIDVMLAPLPIFTLGKDTVFCEGYNKPISILMPGNFTSYTVNHVRTHGSSYDAYSAGQYIFTATDANTCSNSDTIMIFNACPEIFIPNLITPNADHKNDFFCIEGLLPQCTLEIYNQWGNRVYLNTDYNNNWNGESLSDGIYYYAFTSPYYKRTWKGWVQITR